MPVLVIKECKSPAQKNALLNLKKTASPEQFINLVPEGSASQCELVDETIYHKKSFGDFFYMLRLVLRLRVLKVSSVVILFDNSSFKGHTNVKFLSNLCGAKYITGINLDGEVRRYNKRSIFLEEIKAPFSGIGKRAIILLFCLMGIPTFGIAKVWHKLFPHRNKTHNGRKKVLFLIWSLRSHGVAVVVLEILKGLDKTNFETAVLAPLGGKLEDEFRANCDQLHVLGTNNLAAIFRKTLNIVMNGKFDILHSHSYQLGFISQVLGAVFNIPVVLHEHSEVKYRSRLLNFFARTISKGRGTIFVPVSKMVEKRLRKLYRLDKESCNVIYNGIDTSYFKDLAEINGAKKHLGIEPKTFVIGSTGRLATEKGYHILLQALAMLPEGLDYRCFICGTGPDEEKLKSISKDLHIEDRVSLLGYVDDLKEIFSACDLYVKPSLSETQSLALIEGMSLGLPVIGTDIECIREYIIDGENGVIVPVGDARAMSEAIVELISNVNKRLAMAEKGRNTAVEMFDKNVFNNNIRDLYEKVTSDIGCFEIKSRHA